MQHSFQVVVSHDIIHAMVHMILHLPADSMVHMLLHSVGVLDACAAVTFLMWLFPMLLLVMVPLMILLCV